MSDLAIELHDVGLTIAPAVAPDGAEAEPSPGVALIDGDQLHLGSDAEARARLRPKQVHRRFWHEPSMEPLSSVFPSGWTAADLAHAHLESLWEGFDDHAGRVVLVATSAWTPEQLGLVLGIAKSLEIPVAGVVDTALAAVAGFAGEDAARGLDEPPLAPRVVHIDVHQHRTVATWVEHRDGAWQRTRVDVADGVGRASLLDTWARAVNAAFVRATRFEPFHAPETEQDLYDRLPGWLAALSERDTVDATLEGPSGPVRVELDRAALLAAVAAPYRAFDGLLPAGDATLLLSATAAALPDLVDRLDRDGRDVRVLDAAAPARAGLALVDRLVQPGGTLRFVLRLDADTPSTPEPEPVAEPEPEPEPVRLHLEGRGDRLVVAAIDGAVERGDRLLAAGATLAVGDRLVLPSGLALRVEPVVEPSDDAGEDRGA